MSRKLKRPTPNKGHRITPRDSDNTPPEQLPPIFCLCHIDKDYCISKCTKEEKVAFVNKLHTLSQLPWSQLKISHSHGLGYEKINRDSIKSNIPQFIKGDISYFIAFRFHGNAPMVGHKNGRIFHIIWLDRNFTLYRHS